MVTWRREGLGSPSPSLSSVSGTLTTLKRDLRSPRLIVGELLAIVAAGVVHTIVPQVAEPSAARHLAVDHPWWARVMRAVGLDHVFASPIFLAALLLTSLSLGIVLVEQWRRLARVWSVQLTEGSFRSAPYRREIERPGHGTGARATFRTTGRVGLLGSPVFHLGLMTIVVAGLVQWLFSAEAIAELIEGETLASSGWSSVEAVTGPFASPFRLTEPVRLDQLEPSRYSEGSLKGLSARIRVGERPLVVAINAPLELNGRTLYLGSVHGPTALVELAVDGHAERLALLLRDASGDEYAGSWVGPGGLQLLVRGRLGADGALPSRLEVRLLRGGGLLFVGSLLPGQGVEVGGGIHLDLAGVRYWAVFRGTRDASTGIAFAGFVLAALGAVLMFAVVKVDTAVVVRPGTSGERVLVALKANRFPALFAERFERLVRQVAERDGARGR